MNNPKEQVKLIYPEECYKIQGAIFEVYRSMSCGFLESVYQECLDKEFSKQNLPFKSQYELFLSYKGEQLKQVYKPDFLCYGEIIIEIKAVRDLSEVHKAQVFNYLKASGKKLALLVNFGA